VKPTRLGSPASPPSLARSEAGAATAGGATAGGAAAIALLAAARERGAVRWRTLRPPVERPPARRMRIRRACSSFIGRASLARACMTSRSATGIEAIARWPSASRMRSCAAAAVARWADLMPLPGLTNGRAAAGSAAEAAALGARAASAALTAGAALALTNGCRAGTAAALGARAALAALTAGAALAAAAAAAAHPQKSQLRRQFTTPHTSQLQWNPGTGARAPSASLSGP